MKKIVFFLLVFLFVGSYIIKESLDTDFDEEEDKINFLKEFFNWVFQVGKNVKDVTGYAAQQDWLPEDNDTNNTDSGYLD